MLFVDALLDVVGEIGLWVSDNEFRESSDYKIVTWIRLTTKFNMFIRKWLSVLTSSDIGLVVFYF